MASERPLTKDMKADGEALTLREYKSAGGYQGIRKALPMEPKEITDLVTKSGLRGRGGAGFPTGKKWSFVPMGEDAPRPKYLIVNADEMEPGTFKDRLLMEGDPHQLLEGVALAAYAVQANVAYVFVRREYTLPHRRVSQAIAEAGARGYLGTNILGSGFDLELHMHSSAGRYICGEETALLNALEGRRGIPRAKPPYPQASGLWGKPTVVNNVETLCNVPHIVMRGVDWFKSVSRGKDGGTKIYGASGRVRRPGAWELPLGTPVREILEEHAGGMQPGVAFRGLLPGGGSTDFIVEEHLDLPMDFDSLPSAGSRLGTGTMIVLDDKTCPVAMVRNLEHFFAQESCGFCTPCRDGLPWIESVLDDIECGRGRSEDLELLEIQAQWLAPGHTYCAHAPGAVEPLQSALKHFRDDFERHIRDRRCPWSRP